MTGHFGDRKILGDTLSRSVSLNFVIFNIGANREHSYHATRIRRRGSLTHFNGFTKCILKYTQIGNAK